MTIRPFVHQEQMVSAIRAFPAVSYFALAGGYGCGKSFSIVLQILDICRAYQGADVSVGVCSTTITLLSKTVVMDLARVLAQSGSRYEYNQRDNVLKIGSIKFLLIATEQPAAIYGPNLHICLCDEIDELPEWKALEAHKALSERTRLTLPDGRKPYVAYYSTVHGYRGLYKVLHKLKADGVAYVLVRGLTRNNASLDPQYVRNLYAMYSEMERLAYLEGRFVNLQTGRVYPEFDEGTCRGDPRPESLAEVHIGQDLNAGFSKAVAVVVDGGRLFVVRTWSFRDIGGAPPLMRSAYPEAAVYWYPDCAGKEIIKGYREEILAHGIQCRIGRQNPRVLDRVFLVNKLLRLGLLKVSSDAGCNALAEALKTRAYTEQGVPEKGKGENAPDHICDALEYVVWRLVRAQPDLWRKLSAAIPRRGALVEE